MIFANYNPKNCIKMCRSLAVTPGNLFLQKFDTCRNVIVGTREGWDSLASGLLGPLRLTSLGVWGWFTQKIYKGLHFLFSGSLSWSIYICAKYPWNKFDKKAQCAPLWGDLVKMLTIKLWHTSSFSFERTDFKNVIFEKIHWAPSEVTEVAEVKRPRNSKRWKF